MSSLLALDFETHAFRPGKMSPPIVCCTWAEDTRSGILVGNDIPEFLDAAFDRVLDDPEENFLAGSYIAYDMACIVANYPSMVKKVFAVYSARAVLCTEVIEKLLDNAEGLLGYTEYGKLSTLAKKYLDWDLDKSEGSWRMEYERLHGVPLARWPKDAVDYPILDARASLGVVQKQLERAAAMEYTLPDAPDQAAADFALRLASNWGVRTDEARVAALNKTTHARMDELKTTLTENGLYTVRTPQRGKFAGIPQGKKSAKALQVLVTEAFGGKPPKTPSGRVSTDKKTLDDASDRIPIAADWTEFVGLEKTASTYLDKMVEGIRMPLHPRFDVLKKTGRNSSSDPNLHNQPRLEGVRECYKARPGYVYLSSDFNSQEMRTWAQSCVTIVGWSRLAERYRANPDFDPHTAMAAQSLLRISEEEALARLKSDDPLVREAVENARQSSKVSNFGLPGMMGVNGLIGYARGYGQRWAEPDTCLGCAALGTNNRIQHNNCFAARIRAAWRETWPEAASYFAHIKALPGVDQMSAKVVQLFSGRWRGGMSGTDAANSYFQGLASDASKAALFECSRRCYSVETSWLYGCRPVAMIHDEILMEVPEEYAHEAAIELVDVMETAQNTWTPQVPARAGAALMHYWSKKAKAKYDAPGGRMVPWN